MLQKYFFFFSKWELNPRTTCLKSELFLLTCLTRVTCTRVKPYSVYITDKDIRVLVLSFILRRITHKNAVIVLCIRSNDLVVDIHNYLLIEVHYPSNYYKVAFIGVSIVTFRKLTGR